MTTRDDDSESILYEPRIAPSTSTSIAGPSIVSSGYIDSPGIIPVGDVETGLVTPTEEIIVEPPRHSLTTRIVHAIPGTGRLFRFVNRVLGPHHRVTPPPPTPGLILSATFRGKSARASLDDLVVRFSQRCRLHHLWFPYLLLWATGFVLLVRAAYYLPHAPDSLSCTFTFWPDWPPDTCGENGTRCAADLDPGIYRCPGGCENTPLGNPRWVGGESIDGVPLLIGGGDDMGTYRADSWICASALHAGLISPTFGGCVTVTPLDFPDGSSNFKGKKGANGLKSLSFLPHYPAAFRLAQAGTMGQCIEYHYPVMAYNLVLLFIFTAFFAPPPHVLAAVLFVLGFLQISIFSDPYSRPPNWTFIIGGVPQMLFAAYWCWNVSFRRTITGFTVAGMPLDMAIWQGAGFWIGIESSTLFAKIPISRLGYGKLPPDGVIALIVIIIIVVTVVVIQLLAFRRMGYLRYYLKRYLPLVPILIILANLGHGYYLRLHHYMLCLIGIPVMSLPNRISLFGQAFLLGFFLDGIGRWGWASMIEKGSELRGDAAADTILPLVNATAEFLQLPALNATLRDLGISALSVILDDLVWKDNYYGTNFSIAHAGADPSIDHYFRVAYIGNGSTMDFTAPRVWYASNQTWGAPLDSDD